MAVALPHKPLSGHWYTSMQRAMVRAQDCGGLARHGTLCTHDRQGGRAGSAGLRANISRYSVQKRRRVVGEVGTAKQNVYRMMLHNHHKYVAIVAARLAHMVMSMLVSGSLVTHLGGCR